jgi:hypothetical protein
MTMFVVPAGHKYGLSSWACAEELKAAPMNRADARRVEVGIMVVVQRVRRLAVAVVADDS